MSNNLIHFLIDLYGAGEVQVRNKLRQFGGVELADAERVLLQFYELDKLDLPGEAPGFHTNGALWGAQFIYWTSQFILLRDLDEPSIQKYLRPPVLTVDPSVIYSVDLSLRYLGDILTIAKGISPADPLIKHLKKIAADWPLSTANLKLELNEKAIQQVLQDPSLSQAYIDRIIANKNSHLLNYEPIKEAVQTALGNYANDLWPEMDLKTNRL